MHNCYFRRLLHAPPQSDYLKLLNPQVLGQLPTGQGAPQLSWPKDVGCDCFSLLTLSLDMSSGLMVPSNPWGRYRRAFFSGVCLLESLWVVILPWRFHARPIQGVPQMRVWKWAKHKSVCFTLLVFMSWDPEATVAVKGSQVHLRVYFNNYFPWVLCCPQLLWIYFVL